MVLFSFAMIDLKTKSTYNLNNWVLFSFAVANNIAYEHYDLIIRQYYSEVFIGSGLCLYL